MIMGFKIPIVYLTCAHTTLSEHPPPKSSKTKVTQSHKPVSACGCTF